MGNPHGRTMGCIWTDLGNTMGFLCWIEDDLMSNKTEH